MTNTAPAMWSKSRVKALVATNDKAAVRALLVIYARQTASEQSTSVTNEHNGVGFTGCDAKILTSYAKWYETHGWLSAKQMAILKNKIKKYWKQLLSVIEANGLPVTYSVSK